MVYIIKHSSSTRRAAKACLRCRKRRVRCDVTRTELPCANCRRDGRDCVVVSRARMRQEPEVEDVRTVDNADPEADEGWRHSSLSCETDLASREGIISSSPDAKGGKTAGAPSDVDAVFTDPLEPQFYAANEALRDVSAQRHDLVDLDLSLPAELVDTCSSEIAAADVKQAGSHLSVPAEYFGLYYTLAPGDLLGKPPLHHDPMLSTLDQGGWEAALGMKTSRLFNDNQGLWGYIHGYDDGAMPGHCPLSTLPDLPPRPKVSGWIENDRSLYFLHEIGII